MSLAGENSTDTPWCLAATLCCCVFDIRNKGNRTRRKSDYAGSPYVWSARKHTWIWSSVICAKCLNVCSGQKRTLVSPVLRCSVINGSCFGSFCWTWNAMMQACTILNPLLPSLTVADITTIAAIYICCTGRRCVCVHDIIQRRMRSLWNIALVL